jgi:hypothetical protein
MPVKRRTPKHRRDYPEPIAGLFAGRPIEATEENRQGLIAVVYFDDYPELPAAAQKRARELLTEWTNREVVRHG